MTVEQFQLENGYPEAVKEAFDRLFPSTGAPFRKNLFELIMEIVEHRESVPKEFHERDR